MGSPPAVGIIYIVSMISLFAFILRDLLHIDGIGSLELNMFAQTGNYPRDVPGQGKIK
jgi:hypothetical protein